jgi:hypothetical protein
LSASLVTCCVHQPVESSFTKEQENDIAVLPRSENSYMNCRTLLRFFAIKMHDKGWAICLHEPTTKWTADTLTAWLHMVIRLVYEQPPDVFAWISYSLRIGVATTAFHIGTPMRKIKFFGGWVRESDVVLDYIDSTVNTTPEHGSLAIIWLDDP